MSLPPKEEFTVEIIQEQIKAIKDSIRHWEEDIIKVLRENIGEKYTPMHHRFIIINSDKLIEFNDKKCACCRYKEQFLNSYGYCNEIYADCTESCPAVIYTGEECCNLGDSVWNKFNNSVIYNIIITQKHIEKAKNVINWLKKALINAQEYLIEVISRESKEQISKQLKSEDLPKMKLVLAEDKGSKEQRYVLLPRCEDNIVFYLTCDGYKVPTWVDKKCFCREYNIIKVFNNPKIIIKEFDKDYFKEI